MEVLPGYDDSQWLKADNKTTVNGARKLTTDTDLYAGTYGVSTASLALIQPITPLDTALTRDVVFPSITTETFSIRAILRLLATRPISGLRSMAAKPLRFPSGSMTFFLDRLPAR